MHKPPIVPQRPVQRGKFPIGGGDSLGHKVSLYGFAMLLYRTIQVFEDNALFDEGIRHRVMDDLTINKYQEGGVSSLTNGSRFWRGTALKFAWASTCC
jgi:hypothetical protein